MFHRGAVDADGKTGDGAGIMLEVSNSFFSKQVLKMGHRSSQDSILGVGMIFLPKRDFGAQEKCRAIVEYEIIKAGMNLFGGDKSRLIQRSSVKKLITLNQKLNK